MLHMHLFSELKLMFDTWVLSRLNISGDVYEDMRGSSIYGVASPCSSYTKVVTIL